MIISVIVPIYNAERYLSRCIDSILSQTFTDFELLLVNDGSHDNSDKICNEYASKDTRIRVFHKENGGAASARKVGINNAKGNYVFFVDSDDSIEENALEIILLKANEVSCEVIVANTDRNCIIKAVDWAKDILSNKIRTESWGILYKRCLFEYDLLDIPSSIIIGEDLLMNVKCGLVASKVLLTNIHIYNYTKDNNNSLTSKYRLSIEHERIFIMHLDYILYTYKDFNASLFIRKYLTLERIIYLGGNPYNERWVKCLMEDKKLYKLNLKQKVLLSVQCALFCKCFLTIGLRLKSLFK